MRKILITLDYELFFGKSGSTDKCIVEPTERLLSILDKHNIKVSFFVDSGYILKLKEYMQNFDVLKKDYDLITQQIQKLSKEGHDIQLHIHPHWEDSIYDGKQWVFNTNRYKLSDFSEIEIDDVVRRYSIVLEEITNIKPTVFRAGGWCIQPFDKMANALKKYGIRIDSTVYYNGKNTTPEKSFDFTDASQKDNWRFSNDPLIEEEDGCFLEIPISAVKTTPFFYFKFIFNKLFGGDNHKAIGDGSAITNSKKQILELLLKPSYSVASIDGYKASLLNRCAKQNKEQLVLIGHPKAFTPFSLNSLETFISTRRNDSLFTTYSNYNA
ncbi:MAG: polysaccharide deacetylase family protein [Gammaproteobacteria bacterium]|nr:polysaccharide deacetylase family protein [Gammaproteobacteria bacterium]